MKYRLIVQNDLPDIQQWLDYRKQQYVDVDLRCLPPNGFIIPGIAAFWFTMTDSNQMWIDTFISNPRATIRERREAGKTFAALIFGITQKANIKRLMFLTRNPAVERWYAKMLGAKPVGQFTLYKTELG